VEGREGEAEVRPDLSDLKICRPSLVKALWRSFKKDFIVAGIFKLLWGAFVLLAAFYFVRSLLTFVEKPDPLWVGYVLAVFFFLTCVLLSVSLQQVNAHALHVGLRVRSAMLTSVIRKAMRLDATELVVGDVLSTSSNDCSRLLEGIISFHYLWSGAVESIAIMILLIVLVGVSALPGFALVIVLLTFQYVIGRHVAEVRKKNIAVTDKRVGMMNEILNAIKLVKFYAWEQFFSDYIAEVREQELKLMRHGAVIKSVNLMLVFAIPPMMAILIFSTYIKLVGPLPSTIAFTTLSLFNTLRFPLVQLPKALRAFAECVAAVDRIQALLLRREFEEVKLDASVLTGAIDVKKATLQFVNSGPLLHDINLNIRPGQVTAVIGQVGSGKTNLVLALLGQMKLLSGSVSLGGRVSYVPQSPWVQYGTVRDNILFGKPYDEEKYDRVVCACALEKDFETLYNGDRGGSAVFC
jgi:ATP-binding cassette, subfamily C (CFTR/MRP), member 1